MSAFTLKTFDELTTAELYAIVTARTAVFIVEQNCPYQDTDGLDAHCQHLYRMNNGDIEAYLRIFDRSSVADHHSPRREGVAPLGRIITTESARGTGLGHQLVETGIEHVRATMPHVYTVFISAQEPSG
ncbi:GNAT family N-acetyltransferase [Rothia sp. ZJ932]|uniref:GNAT family N-acetyltransferase n=1 Tax=Rothia sp. ZJ932 TaxID=2810516 RepID=UPI001967B17E|nr:GNAT family N-acetyltransferase [Rothia sp. ZJ932]QRZ61404.1 hypothetical protein JR346_09290 [Rothia sp. ZJ932]